MDLEHLRRVLGLAVSQHSQIRSFDGFEPVAAFASLRLGLVHPHVADVSLVLLANAADHHLVFVRWYQARILFGRRTTRMDSVDVERILERVRREGVG